MKAPQYSKYLQTIVRFDAGESAAPARALEHVEQQITDVLYAETKALEYVPMITGVDPGADTFTWRQSDEVGDAEENSDRADDIYDVDVLLEEFSSGIKSIAVQYGYSTQELRAVALAARRGVELQLDSARADVAMRVLARRIDNRVAFGDPRSNNTIRGFLNAASIPTRAAAGAWSSLSADALANELFAMVNAVTVATRETILPDTILLPMAQMNLVLQTKISTTADKTVLTYFSETMRAAGRPIDVRCWPLLDLANAGRNGPRAVCYKRDPSMLGAVVPIAAEAQAPQQMGLRFVVPIEARCGGTIVRRPSSAVYTDGI